MYKHYYFLGPKRPHCWYLFLQEEEWSDCNVMEGHFTSPFVHHLPGLLPSESENAYFQVILPKKWSSKYYKPICLHMAGTGDHVSKFMSIGCWKWSLSNLNVDFYLVARDFLFRLLQCSVKNFVLEFLLYKNQIPHIY